MRRILAVLLILTTPACTRAQVARFTHHSVKEVTRAQAQVFTDGLARLIAKNDPFLVCTRGHESANLPDPYKAYNPAGPWYGAYQFTQSTWDTAAQHAGRPDLVGADILNVAWWDQDFIALSLYRWIGASPWGGRCSV